MPWNPKRVQKFYYVCALSNLEIKWRQTVQFQFKYHVGQEKGKLNLADWNATLKRPKCAIANSITLPALSHISTVCLWNIKMNLWHENKNKNVVAFIVSLLHACNVIQMEWVNFNGSNMSSVLLNTFYRKVFLIMKFISLILAWTNHVWTRIILLG